MTEYECPSDGGKGQKDGGNTNTDGCKADDLVCKVEIKSGEAVTLDPGCAGIRFVLSPDKKSVTLDTTKTVKVSGGLVVGARRT